jgi:2-(1,2-epoxy-1,2-dihydrophenyl)acetyl-CoA isomerase
LTFKNLLVTCENRITTITLNRPESMNALDPATFQELLAAVRQAGEDKETRVVVLTGAGRAFCAGGDMKRMEGGTGLEPAAQREEIRINHQIVKILHEMEKPVIGSINGVAVGAGCDLALACDIRIASSKARFGEVFANVGLVPDAGGTYFLPRLVGPAKACELILTGRIIDAAEAERIGLVNRVVPPEDLEKETKALAAKLAEAPPLAVGMAKTSIWRGLHMDLAAELEYEAYAQAVLMKTDDYAEGVRAFAEKRKPQFKGC